MDTRSMTRNSTDEIIGYKNFRILHSKDKNFSAPNLSKDSRSIQSNLLLKSSKNNENLEEQNKKQRELADKINNYAPLNELRIQLMYGATAYEAVTQGLTPLHYACYRNYYEAAKLLIVRGANVNAIDEAGYTPLHLCAEKGHFKLIKLLVDNMAKVCFVNKKDNDVTFPLRDGVDEPLAMAIRRGHFECAKYLLDSGADPNTKYFDGPEITHISATETKFIHLLLTYGANPNCYSRDGLTPLMKACRLKEKGIDTIKVLLKYGANINAQALPKQDNRTALHYAVLSGSYELIKLLIDLGANINMEKGYDKASPLDLAILKDDTKIVEIILQAGGNPNLVHTYIGSALHLACCSNLKNQIEIIQLLLKYGGDVNLKHTFPEGGIMKSPMVEYFRSTDNVNIDLVNLMLSYGGKIIMKSPLTDPRGQLRNILKLSITNPTIFYALCDLGEDYDQLAVQRLPLNHHLKDKIIDKMKNPKSLQHTCRLMLRNYLAPLNPTKVEKLPIPEMTKNYILGVTL
uniref:SOCS box domain-containing protein n=2 Tax=Strongyloides stercoralis TaxID=6248 RepID=A0A0K0E1I5_STRER